MGVWQRSPAGVAIAMTNTALTDSFESALPGYEPADVAGSPYCIRDYVVDGALGGPAGLAVARQELARRGVALILDFVPNHVAPDHPWVSEHPERLVTGSQEDLRDEPGAFVEVAGRVVANGKDPYTGAWPDVVQLNAFSQDLRDAQVATLRDIADQCDGVRCDMAMLMMNETFARTWGARVGAAPAGDYWPEVIAAVRERHPDFCFIAEAYWDLEWELQSQGFDYCYDKRLYDRLLHETAEDVRLHLTADTGYQQRSAAIRREPRRAPSGFGAPSRATPSGGGGDADPGRRPTGPRRADRGPTDAPAGLLEPLPRRTGRSRAGRLLRRPARGTRRPHVPHRLVAAVRPLGLGGQRRLRAHRVVVLGGRDPLAGGGEPQRRVRSRDGPRALGGPGRAAGPAGRPHPGRDLRPVRRRRRRGAVRRARPLGLAPVPCRDRRGVA